MRHAFHLLLCLTVVLCGLHLTEPSDAKASLASQNQCVASAPADCGETPDTADTDVHVGHHHCPIAPIDRSGSLDLAQTRSDNLLFVRSIAVLDSRSQAPPLEPPTA